MARILVLEQREWTDDIDVQQIDIGIAIDREKDEFRIVFNSIGFVGTYPLGVLGVTLAAMLKVEAFQVGHNVGPAPRQPQITSETVQREFKVIEAFVANEFSEKLDRASADGWTVHETTTNIHVQDRDRQRSMTHYKVMASRPVGGTLPTLENLLDRQDIEDGLPLDDKSRLSADLADAEAKLDYLEELLTPANKEAYNHWKRCALSD